MMVLLLSLADPAAAWAQARDTGPKPELRVDVIASAGRASVQAGGGAQIPAGDYTRIGVIGAAGTDVVDGSPHPSGRVDVLARFLLDPFRQTTWGFSAGAGISMRARTGDRVRPLLLAVLDWEGPRRQSGVSPAFQIGLGGGVRIGGAVRWGGPGER